MSFWKGGLFVRQSKTKAGRRLIPYHSHRAIDILKLRMKNAENGFLFTGGRDFVDNTLLQSLG